MKSLVLIFLGMLITIPAIAGYGDYYVVPGGPGYTSDFFLPTAITVDYSSSSDDQGRVLPTPASRNTKSTLAAPSAKTSKWPKKLAKKFPKEQRKDWQRAFSMSLKTYYKLEKNLKIPKGDIAGAVAAYISGNYMAYHNIGIPNNEFVSLVDQMRSILINMPELKRTKKPAKRDLYERMAIGGVFMAIALLDLKSQPNQVFSDNLQLAAKNNLEQFFGVSVSNIEITNGQLIIYQ